MHRLRVVLHATLLAVVFLTTSAALAKGSFRQFDHLRDKAMAAERAGHWEEAARLWEQAHAMAPDAFEPSASLADAMARLGRKDEAFTWLEKAFGDSDLDPSYLEEDEDLASLRDDPRWTELIGKLKSKFDHAAAEALEPQTDLDPQTAPSFKSHRRLAKSFDRQAKAADKERWQLSIRDYLARKAAIDKRRIAALHRYLAEHPRAEDRSGATWDVIDTRLGPGYAGSLYYRWINNTVAATALGEIDAFLRDYPGDPHAGQASLERAFVALSARREGGTGERPWRPEDMATLDHDLEETAKKYSGTTAGGLALAWRLIAADMNSPEVVTPEMRSMKAQLEANYSHDRGVMKIVLVDGRAALLRMASLDGFEGTDLAGTHWTNESFKGKVTLIDFWATWCGPCVRELPTIRKAWAAYHDKGLTILGVSLDFDDRATFEGWLARNDVKWPQIWDGKGFSTPLARKFGIYVIPFAVLVDRDGKVAAAGLHGDELLARIGKLLGAANKPTGGPPSSH